MQPDQDRLLDDIFNRMDEKSVRYGGIETHSLTRPLAKLEIKALIAREVRLGRIEMLKKLPDDTGTVDSDRGPAIPLDEVECIIAELSKEDKPNE